MPIPQPERSVPNATRPARPSAIYEPTPRVAATTGSLWAIGLALILAVFAARCLDTAATYSVTTDEVLHLTAALGYWSSGDDRDLWIHGAPRAPHLLGGLASHTVLVATGRLPTGATVADMERLVVADDPWVLVPARAVAMVWGLVLIGVTAHVTRRERGTAIALAAAGLLSLTPEVIAHASIAGSDMPFTASAIAAIALLARFASGPSRGRWIAAALAVGVSWSTRHSALILLPLAALVRLWTDFRAVPRSAGAVLRRSTRAGLAIASFGLIAFVVLWGSDGFRVVRPADHPKHAAFLRLPQSFGPTDLRNVPWPTSLLSVRHQLRHQDVGHQAFLCGTVRRIGWKTYFPRAFALKTPLGLLALMVAAAARFRPGNVWERCAGLALLLLWVILIGSRVDIGVRYALLTYPLAVPFVGRHFSREALRDRVWGPLAIACALWMAAASVAAHPGYLSSFNEIAGGSKSGWMYLADSNLDWGQDVRALDARLRTMGIGEVSTALGSRVRLKNAREVRLEDLRAERAQGREAGGRRVIPAKGQIITVPTRHVAVSATRLHGIYASDDLGWLRSRRIAARVGDGIFVFDLDSPADRPIWEP